MYRTCMYLHVYKGPKRDVTPHQQGTFTSTVVSRVSAHGHLNITRNFGPRRHLTWDITSIHLYRSCYIDPLKWAIWTLTREWAFARDTTVHNDDDMHFTFLFFALLLTSVFRVWISDCIALKLVINNCFISAICAEIFWQRKKNNKISSAHTPPLPRFISGFRLRGKHIAEIFRR